MSTTPLRRPAVRWALFFTAILAMVTIIPLGLTDDNVPPGIVEQLTAWLPLDANDMNPTAMAVIGWTAFIALALGLIWITISSGLISMIFQLGGGLSLVGISSLAAKLGGSNQLAANLFSVLGILVTLALFSIVAKMWDKRYKQEQTTS